MTSADKASESADLDHSKRPHEFLVRRDDLHQTEWCPLPDPDSIPLAPGQILLVVDTFAFTANNITYAVFGQMMNYWDFFPAREGWGSVPVWGYSTIARSSHPELHAGERIYGYMPMSTYFVVEAGNVTPSGFTEISTHRRELAAFYNVYSRTAGDPSYDARHEAEQALFRPLLATGFLIDDFLADSDFFGARSVIVSSASSKTSIGLSFCLSQRGRDKVEVVGLTSRSNKAFVEGVGLYHRVVLYDDIASLPNTTPTVFVDMAGDSNVTRAIHERFGDALRYSCSVGGTHWQNLGFGVEVPGPRPILFFAPGHIARRLEDWGGAELNRRVGETWLAFLQRVAGWIEVDRARGHDAIERVYRATLDGKADPKRGYVLSF